MSLGSVEAQRPCLTGFIKATDRHNINQVNQDDGRQHQVVDHPTAGHLSWTDESPNQ